jgi:hypothetical protein
MYPAFPDVLRAIRENLMRELMPELTTDYAREQATGTLLLIEHLLSRWDRAVEALREENDDLRATLARIAEAGSAGGGGAESRGAGAGGGGVYGSSRVGEQNEGGCSAAGRGEELSAANRELRARLAAVIASAPDGSAALLLAEGFMARQVERELAAVAVGALTWE